LKRFPGVHGTVLPDEARLIDFSKVEFLRDEHFTDVQRGSADGWTW